MLVGEEADAKRAKREGQEDAAAAKVSKGWTVSPAELREALSSISHAALQFDLTDMHDAAEVGSQCLPPDAPKHALPACCPSHVSQSNPAFCPFQATLTQSSTSTCNQ